MRIVLFNKFFSEVAIEILGSDLFTKAVSLTVINYGVLAAVCVRIKLINLGTLFVIILVRIDKQEVAILCSNAEFINNDYSVKTSVNQFHISSKVDGTCPNRRIAERIVNGLYIYPIFSILRCL